MEPIRTPQEVEAALKDIQQAMDKLSTGLPEMQANALKTASAAAQFANEFNKYLQKHPDEAKKIVDAYDKDEFEKQHEAEMHELFNQLEQLRKKN